MSKQASRIARSIRNEIANITDAPMTELDSLETAFPWPDQDKPLWPKADISGQVSTGEVFIVEIDEHADPGRRLKDNLATAWPRERTYRASGSPPP